MKKQLFVLCILISLNNYAQECVERVVSGENVVTIFLTNGDIYSWGNNQYGELGNNTTTPENSPVPTVMSNLWQDISHGRYHSLALNHDGTLWAWGNNQNGELGDGTTTDRLSPVQVGTDSDWVAVSGGFLHSLALKSDGTLWGWGSNWGYELLNTNTQIYTTPVQLSNETDWNRIFAGVHISFGIKTDGTLWVRGRSFNGSLGVGQTAYAVLFEQVGSDNNWAEVSASERSHILALKTNNTLWTWGEDSPLTPTTTISYIPRQIGTDEWKDIAVGWTRSTAIKMDGTLWQWGGPYACYHGTTYKVIGGNLAPVQIESDNDWVSLTTNYFSSFAIKDDFTLWNWELLDCVQVAEVSPTMTVNCTDLNNPDFDLTKIVFYPNPVHYALYWTTNVEFSSYEIRNILGQNIKSGTVIGNQLNLSEVNKGVYFIIFQSAKGKTISHKLIIN